MPLRKFVHVVGFEVPVGVAFAHEPVLVMLDRVPGEEWRAVFQLCVEALSPELLRQAPSVQGTQIHVHLAKAPTRGLAAEIRALVDRVNRMTFLREGSGPPPGAGLR